MYKDQDFNKTLFNPLKKGSIFEAYPRLEKLKDIGVDERLVKYIICVYDYNSPFVRDYKDLKLRKQTAAQFVGYDLGKDASLLDDLFDFKNSTFIDAVDIFLKEFINSMLYYGICANEQTYWEYGKRMMQPIDAADSKEKDIISAIATKSKLSEDMANIRGRIENDYRKLYGDDDLEKAVNKKKFRPEDNATRVM